MALPGDSIDGVTVTNVIDFVEDSAIVRLRSSDWDEHSTPRTLRVFSIFYDRNEPEDDRAMHCNDHFWKPFLRPECFLSDCGSFE